MRAPRLVRSAVAAYSISSRSPCCPPRHRSHRLSPVSSDPQRLRHERGPLPSRVAGLSLCRLREGRRYPSSVAAHLLVRTLPDYSAAGTVYWICTPYGSNTLSAFSQTGRPAAAHAAGRAAPRAESDHVTRRVTPTRPRAGRRSHTGKTRLSRPNGHRRGQAMSRGNRHMLS